MESQSNNDLQTGRDATLTYASTAPDQRAGRYRLLRLLGEGAFGKVWLAVDEELRRQVAIKIPQPERFQKPQDAELYLAEARVVATLDHPNIVPVYDIGRTGDGSVYVVSKFIEGTTAADRIKNNRPNREESAAIVATAAEALHHAHQNRLIHRDVKPANILLEASTNKAYVADFGLAIREEDVSIDGRMAGTPAYMSPEQASGEGHRLDGRSDVFSLGAVLYELLTGKKPFPGSTHNEVMHQVTTMDPRVPREHDEAIPPELERICLKALSKRASDRYASAAQMALELREWRQGPAVVQKERTIVPKGLRSFDADDADYFLELMPGPRGREGIPESIRFWKTLIEETDPEQTFRVGLLYGPSGCGKSSLVKAGLLPRLSGEVVAVYVESTAEETELRILRGTCKRLPELSEELGLVESLTMVRRHGGRKVVLILDQFEQWLHGHREDSDAELIWALRQCDGSNLQAVVMVRDDFAMAAARFMQSLDIPIVERLNFATVDLFDIDHAKKVLVRFGQAFGKLPAQSGRMSEEEIQFISTCVSGLAQDGKVVSVQLALFAEMVKGKPWVPATLEEVGGTEGIGVNFLEETFRSRSANPRHQLHESAACGVLRALLPEVGTDIKGHMRSYAELLVASRYEGQPGEFVDLLRVLDGELRLITPTDPAGGKSDSGTASDPSSRFYQLTHDYMVPSLREWLTRRQRETRRGRVELRLAERAALWKAKPENRHLPSLLEYLSIRRWTKKNGWSESEQRMMVKARRVHAVRGGVVLVMLSTVILGGLFVSARVEEQRRADQAMGLVAQLSSADVGQVPTIVERIHEYRQFADPLLRGAHAKAAEGSAERLHLALALLPVDSLMVTEIRDRLPLVTPSQFPVVRDALLPHNKELVEPLWSVALDDKRATDEQFRAACALATYTSEDARWEKVSELVAGHLVSLQASEYLAWREALRPARRQLIEPLAAVYRDGSEREQARIYATETLGDYAGDHADVLLNLLADAEPFQFPIIFEKLARHREPAIAYGKEEVAKQPGKDATEDEKETLAKRQSNIAVALAKLGATESVWPVLKHSPDPRVRSYLIHALGPLGADPRAIIDRFDREPDVTIRRALLLALGEFNQEQLPQSEREKLVYKLTDVFENHPDPGLHGASEWLLRQWGQQTRIAAIVERLKRTEAQLQAAKETEKRQWFVNTQGQTFMLVERGEFPMGSPESEPDRDADEVLHQHRIVRRYAIATHETTTSEYQRFLKAVKQREKSFQWVPTADSPAAGVTWYEAAWYCNWLSKVEGIDKEQWCYEANDKGIYGPGMKVKETHLDLIGYRLLTEAEWEYSCRAGSTTRRYYGASESLLPSYAWSLSSFLAGHSGNGAVHRAIGKYQSWPVAKLKPNEIGLFDMQGNAIEWCFDAYAGYVLNEADPSLGFTRLLLAQDDLYSSIISVDSESRVARGGSFADLPAYLRSANRSRFRPDNPGDNTGFRVARTYP